MNKEIWKDIEGYEGRYQVSNLGRVKSLVGRHGKRDLILKGNFDKNGYGTVNLNNGDKVKNFKIHRLVATAFIENPLSKPTVNHRDGNKINNRADNLEWATRSEQTRHALKTGLITVKVGEKASNAKLRDSDIKRIREEYIPYNREHSTYAIAKKYGVKEDSINRVIKRKTFKHVD